MAVTKTKSAKKNTKGNAGKNGRAPAAPPQEVLTLSEAAAYLRVSESDVLNIVHAQGLVGRQIAGEWRFLKASLQDWLRTSPRKSSQQALLDMAGKSKDDPDLEEICREAYRQRGRPITEDAE